MKKWSANGRKRLGKLFDDTDYKFENENHISNMIIAMHKIIAIDKLFDLLYLYRIKYAAFVHQITQIVLQIIIALH